MWEKVAKLKIVQQKKKLCKLFIIIINLYKPAKPTGEALAIASASCSVLNLMKKTKTKKQQSAAGRRLNQSC